MRQNNFALVFSAIASDLVVDPPQVKELRLVQVRIRYEGEMAEHRLLRAAEYPTLAGCCHRPGDLDALQFLLLTIFAGVTDIVIITLKFINLNQTFRGDTLECLLRQWTHFNFPALPTLLFPATGPKLRRLLLN